MITSEHRQLTESIQVITFKAEANLKMGQKAKPARSANKTSVKPAGRKATASKKESPKEPRQKNRPEAEARLIQAAKEVFAEQGYDGATTRMVAEKSGVNLALITRYFGNKHGLLLAVIEHEGAAAFARPLPYPPQDTVLEECLAYADATLRSHLSHEELFRIVIVQTLTNREFAATLRSRHLLHSRNNIRERLTRFFANSPTQENIPEVFEIVEFLQRNIVATAIVPILIGGEPLESCLAQLQEVIRAYLAQKYPEKIAARDN